MPKVLYGILLLLLASTIVPKNLLGFTYEVLFDGSIGKDAVRYGRLAFMQAEAKAILLDGQVKFSGTDASSYDRSLLYYAQFSQQLVLSPNAALRFSLPMLTIYNKQEGGQVPRQIGDSTRLESKPKIEVTYATQNALDLVLGLNSYYISAHKFQIEAENFSAVDSYKPAQMIYGHLALVKHAGNFDAGFSLKMAAEKPRKVIKTTSLEADSFIVEDRVFEPKTVAIFVQSRPSFGVLFGEFSATEASGGGNRTDRGATVKEDYFRVQLASIVSLGSKDMQFESNFIYKNLSYADSRSVTFDTIPMLGFQLKLHLNLGAPVFMGLTGLWGTDRQSIPEFNANYKIFGLGAVAGVRSSF